MRVFRSVAFKLSLLSSLFVLAVIGFMARRINAQIERSLIAEMRLRADFFARSCREALFPKVDAFALHFTVRELMKEKAVVYAAVLDPEGGVLSHSDPQRVGETVAGGPILKALESPSPLVQEYRHPSTGEETFEVSVPVLMVNKRVGTAVMGFSRSSVREALSESRRRILLIALVAIALAILGTTLIVNWIIRPLPRLAEAARRVGRGNFDVQVDVRSRDEIGTLARAFNEMTIANALLFKSLREEKEKIETVFNQTHEGLVWTDQEGNLLLANRIALELMGSTDGDPGTMQRALEDFVCEPSAGRILSSERRMTPFEFTRREPKTFILSGVAERIGWTGHPPSFIFIFHDATVEKREEELSRNFLSLVSHKLRTPLMVVMSYVDLLQEEPEHLNAFQSESLKKMERHVGQLQDLVKKLLAYTTVQSKDTLMLQREELKLTSVVESSVKSLTDFLEKSGAEVRWGREAMALLPAVRADSQLIEEVIKGLIENAVKFNPAEKKEVRIDARKEDGFVRVAVADNGPGIPPEEHPKLFRKFYQVDDDFTGQTSGMGLGLAFVKNVVEAHGGQAGLKSKPGEGSEFFFTLPVTKKKDA